MEAGGGPSPPRLVGDRVDVAVGGDVRKSKSTLSRALQCFGGRFPILHVQQPPEDDDDRDPRDPSLNQLHGYGVRTPQELARQNMDRTSCWTSTFTSVSAEKRYIEMQAIGKGMAQLIEEHAIEKLITGAAAHRRYFVGIAQLKSTSAIFVNQQADPSCYIWFICKRQLIYVREGDLNKFNTDVPPSSVSVNSAVESGLQNLRSPSTGSSALVKLKMICPWFGLREARGSIINQNQAVKEVMMNSMNNLTEQWQRLQKQNERPMKGGSIVKKLPMNFVEGSNDELYEQLDRAMTEAANAKREAYEEWIHRQKADKIAIDAACRVKALEEDLRRRKDREELLAKEKEALEMTKKQLEESHTLLENALEVNEELLTNAKREAYEEWIHRQKAEKIAIDATRKVKALEEDLRRRKGLEELLAKEKEALEMTKKQLQNALKVNEEILTNQQDYLSKFSFAEIKEATNSFDPFLRIDRGKYGSTYKGFLYRIPVTIKMFFQGCLQYHQEVQTASKLRHPNLVNFIGVCTEDWTLIYEYLPNGSLEDRLCCTGNTAPLSWQTRVRICTETCAAIIFLHYHGGIAHGDLKPGNILLDTNFRPKLIKSGLSREPMAGERSFASDVYSFGLIVLRLLIGKSSLKLKKTVQDLFVVENLKCILDSTAGHWPLEQARELARVALRCCDISPSNRPELKSEVWPVLEQMRILSEGPSSICSGPEEPSQPPPYFVCPIYQEIMQNPHVAADGFTYEADAIRCWFSSGHNTSPMTNLRLANLNLVPNQTLRSAIQDWLQDHRTLKSMSPSQ